MLRDNPYIIGLILILTTLIGIGTVSYIVDINEDTTVTTLNETLRATTINQIDLASRVDPGHVYLNQSGSANLDTDNPDFETDMLLKFNDELKDGSLVRFDYAIKETTEDIPATTYKYHLSEDDKVSWSLENVAGTRPLDQNESVEGVRVRVRSAGHTANVDDPNDQDYWSYQSTVEVNRSDKIVSVMEDDTVIQE